MEIINCFGEVVYGGNHQDFTQDDRAVFLENLLMFFFTVKTAAHSENDIIWFLRYVNSPPHPSSGSPLAPSKPSPLPHLPSAVLQHILGAVLTFLPNHEKLVPPLNLFRSKVQPLAFLCFCMQSFIRGQIFWGYIHICIYICTHAHMARHKHVYSMILKTTLMHVACISGFLS